MATVLLGILSSPDPLKERLTCYVCEFLSLPDRGAIAVACRALSKALYHPNVWSTLDLRGSKDANKTLAYVYTKSSISDYIRRLNLEFCKTIENCDLLPVKKGLEYLNLNALHKLSDTGIVSLVCVCGATLISLELYWQHALANDSIVAIAKSCPSIRSINLSGCQKLEDSGARALARNCPRLTDLNLTRCPLLTDAALTFVCPRLSGLQHLNLFADSQFGDEGCLAIASLRHLKSLDICGFGKIDAKTVTQIARGCVMLEYLNLTWCVKVDDSAIASVASYCPHLRLLSVYGLRGVTDASLEALAAPGACRNSLTTLDVHGCCNITRHSESELRVLFPYLQCFSHHS